MNTLSFRGSPAAVAAVRCKAEGRSHHMPRDRSPKPHAGAYVDALKMLARRERSEAQIRERLARRGHSVDEVESATIRLKDQGAIDDVRVARAIARTQVSVKRRGRMRVRWAIEAAGIARETARRVVDELFGEVDGGELLERALAARLPQGRAIRDEREFQRLYRFLMTQGFEADQVMRVLSERRKAKPEA